MMEDPQSSPSLRAGSPMMEDPPNLLHEVLKPQSKPESIVPDKTPTSDTSSLRRTTRSRRSAAREGNSRPRPTRRKPAFNRMDDVFSGMSITALKDLTTSNTARNQEYLFAKLETEVIRKEGVRPESPVVKFVQRETEDKMKERAERAIRRARRSSGDMVSSDIEGGSDVGYSSPCEDRSGDSRPPTKYRRGPGDESDYETPERLDRHKKAKLFVEADDQDDEPERRVKWDRGLFTSVYLDEVKLGTRQTLKENRSLKGILAPTAKVCYSEFILYFWRNLTQVRFRLFDWTRLAIYLRQTYRSLTLCKKISPSKNLYTTTTTSNPCLNFLWPRIRAQEPKKASLEELLLLSSDNSVNTLLSLFCHLLYTCYPFLQSTIHHTFKLATFLDMYLDLGRFTKWAFRK